MTEIKKALTPSESEELVRCIAIIDRGMTGFIEVGTALLKIRGSRLYRESHDTFEDFCRERWSMTKSRANQMIDAANVVGNLTTMVVNPTSERQARPLASLSPTQQREVWTEAVRTAPNGKVTAAHVERVRDELIIVDEVEPTFNFEEEEPAPPPIRHAVKVKSAGEKWGEIEYQACVSIRSFQKEGGVKNLARNWTREEIEEFMEVLIERSQSFQDLANELREMIS